jgi:hypothetical protein
MKATCLRCNQIIDVSVFAQHLAGHTLPPKRLPPILKKVFPPAAFLSFFLLASCSISLRPVQKDHALRRVEIIQKLDVDPVRLDSTLAADKTECDALDGKVTAWTGVSIASGVLAGGGGLTSILTDDSVARYVVGGVGLAVAVVTAVSSYLSTSYASKYSRTCAVNMGGK